VIKTGVRGDALASAGLLTAHGKVPKGPRDSYISNPSVSVVLPGLRTRLADRRNLQAVHSDPHEYPTTCFPHCYLRVQIGNA